MSFNVADVFLWNQVPVILSSEKTVSFPALQQLQQTPVVSAVLSGQTGWHHLSPRETAPVTCKI